MYKKGEAMTKEVRAAMPQGAESFRARMLTMGLAFVLLKLKFPSKAVLRTASVELFHKYTHYLFGPKVWGEATLGLDGKPTATPHLHHVIIYDMAIRGKIADLMNAGYDIETAFGQATADGELTRTHFTAT